MRLNLIRVTSEIVALAKSGRIGSARKLFDETPHKDSVCWNAMLSSYSQLGFYQQALSLFHCLRILSSPKPDNFTYTAALSATSGANNVTNGTMIHGLAIVSGFASSLPVSNALIDMYGKCSIVCAARRVFDEMDSKNHVSWCSLLFAYMNCGEFRIATKVFNGMTERGEIAWNIMISGHAWCGDIESCLLMFKNMQKSSCQPDQWTYSAVMNACADSGDSFNGQAIHSIVIRSGWSSAVEANNSLISFYAKLGCGCDVIWLFESSRVLNQVSWNAIIDAHMKMGNVHKARVLFEQTPEKNVVSWTSMVSGYARNGQGEEALKTFHMMRNCVQPDYFSFGAALHSCSILAIVGYGQMVHGSLIHYGYNLNTYVGNGLINMYAKCGDIDGSSRAFRDIIDKDLVSWNAMLLGFGLHGRGNQALQLYEKMLALRIRPDKVTFIGLLMTCSHLGLIQKGREFFESMPSHHRIPQEIDHVACMVDMLSRGGYLEEAKELSRAFSRTNKYIDSSSREAILGACLAQRDVEIGTELAETWNISEPRKDVNYVTLSNLYCVNGMWTEAEAVRNAMVENRVKKMPGYSSIDVRNKTIAFTAGYNSDSCMDELYKVLYFLELEMRTPWTNLP